MRAVVVLMPGSNGDARAAVEDPVWQAFAVKHQLALVGCHITDKPHEQSFIEEYANVSQGSGDALLNALTAFASRASHPELGGAPLLLWGMSAGGQFNYEFVAWKPERVVAFVVNKGGIYYTALAPRASRDVPGMLFIGGKDLESRIQTITGLFAVNRRAGALWALAEEPGAAHIVGRSRDLSLIFFDSSEKSVGEFRFGQFAKRMIECQFGDSEGSEPIGFSHCDFCFVVQTLDYTAGKLLSRPKIVKDEFAVGA
jgi:dienelactone hydrolase